MCSDTKGRIAEAVEQMLQTKPVCKITVQSVMEQTQMKRQSFYYHYQDIYNVLEWIVETEVCTPLQFDDAQAPGEWCLQALTLLREKQQLMRKNLAGTWSGYDVSDYRKNHSSAACPALAGSGRGRQRDALPRVGYALSGHILHG